MPAISYIHYHTNILFYTLLLYITYYSCTYTHIQWQKHLANIADVFLILGEIQRTWSYLEPLFIHSDEVKRELPGIWVATYSMIAYMCTVFIVYMNCILHMIVYINCILIEVYMICIYYIFAYFYINMHIYCTTLLLYYGILYNTLSLHSIYLL